jgi:hypothetical protein
MLLVILWNKHIERYADLRFRTETTSPRDICQWANFAAECHTPSSFNVTIVEPASSEIVQSTNGVDGQVNIEPAAVEEFVAVNWMELEAEDNELANEVRGCYGISCSPLDFNACLVRV